MSDSTDPSNLLSKKAMEVARKVAAQRETILQAFIAETGLNPSECEQVIQSTEEGFRWFVRKKVTGPLNPSEFERQYEELTEEFAKVTTERDRLLEMNARLIEAYDESRDRMEKTCETIEASTAIMKRMLGERG